MSKRSFRSDQPLHRVRRRRIHADAAVPVERHEAEGRIDLVADDRQVEPVALGDARPVVHAGAAQRIDAHADRRRRGSRRSRSRCRGRRRRRRGSRARAWSRRARACASGMRLHALRGRLRAARSPASSIQPVTSVSAGPPLRRVVLEAAVVGRVVRRRDDDAVGQPASCGRGCGRGSRARPPASACIRRRAAIIDLDAVGGQHFERARERRLRQRVRVDAEEQRPVDALLAAVLADRLADREHVRFVEAAFERRAAVARGAEGDALRRQRRIGPPVVVGGDAACRRRRAAPAGAACRRAD